MAGNRTGRILLAGVLLVVLGLQVGLLIRNQMEWEQAWLSILLLFLASYSLTFGGTRAVEWVLPVLLISVSVLVTGVPQEELLSFPGWMGQAADVLWTALLLLIPFAFVHFALQFPIPNEWVRTRRWFTGVLYGFWSLSVLATLTEPLAPIAEKLTIILFPVGFVAGLLIFVWQYRYSLTLAEKNRLWLILLGCMAGLAPRFLFLLLASHLPFLLGQVTVVLLPVFPISLLIAVHRKNMSQTGPWFRHIVSGTLLGSILLGGFILILAGTAVMFPGRDQDWLMFSLAAIGSGVLLGLPGSRLLRRYFTTQFKWRLATQADRSADPAGAVEAFVPIRPNPFIVGNPIRSTEMFFGRTAEFQFIERTLQQSKGGCAIILSGQRRTGKTSILFQLHNGRLGEQFATVFLDMQGLIVENDLEFLSAVAEEIGKLQVGVPGLSESAERSSGFRRFVKFFEPVVGALGSRRLLLLIDEYELIEDRIRAGVLTLEIPRLLSSLIEFFPGVSIVLTGSREFEAGEVWADLIGKTRHREISFLQERDAEALLREPLRDRATFSPEGMTALLRLSHGHPFYTQLLGQNLVDVLNEFRIVEVTPDLVQEVLSRFIKHPPPQLLYTWGGFSPVQKLILSAIAASLSSSEEYCPWSTVVDLLSSIPERPEASGAPDEVRIELEALRRHYILDRDQERYRFSIDLMRHWIRSERSPWSVLSELRGASPTGHVA